MAEIGIFSGDVFSMENLTTAVNKRPFLPTFLRDLGLFTPNPIETQVAGIEKIDGKLALIPLSKPGEALAEGESEKRKLYYQPLWRIAKGHTIQASAIQSIRAFGRTSELESAAMKIAAAQDKLLREVDQTVEYLYMGTVQGKLVDPGTGSTVVDWHTVYGDTPNTEIGFDLANASPASGAIRKKCAEVVQKIQDELGDMWIMGSRVIALCDNGFYNDLIAAKETRETYQAQDAARLREASAYLWFDYEGIRFINYKGNSKVAVPTDKCKFVPVGVPGLFDEALGPYEGFPYVNTPGLERYSLLIIDDKRGQWVRPEVYSYRLPICTQPKALFSGRKGS